MNRPSVKDHTKTAALFSDSGTVSYEIDWKTYARQLELYANYLESENAHLQKSIEDQNEHHAGDLHR